MNWVKDWKYVPREAFLYFPKGEQVKSGTGSTFIRRIFETGQPYEPFEQQKLKELNENLKKKNVAIIDFFKNEPNRLRFLLAKKFDVDDTRKCIQEHCKWRSTTFPIKQTPKIKEFLNSGAIYFCGRDHCFRPIIVFDISKFNLKDSQALELQFLSKILAIYYEFMIEELLIEGQVENYVMIINLNDYGVFDIGGLMKRILSFTTNTYRSRLYVAYIVNCPKSLGVMWNSIKGFVSENTSKKINMFTNNDAGKMLFEHCNKDQVEVKFNGTKPNIEREFWLPECLARRQTYSSEKLISAGDYFERFSKNKLLQRKVCKEIIDQETPRILSSIKEESNTPRRTSNGSFPQQFSNDVRPGSHNTQGQGSRPKAPQEHFHQKNSSEPQGSHLTVSSGNLPLPLGSFISKSSENVKASKSKKGEEVDEVREDLIFKTYTKPSEIREQTLQNISGTSTLFKKNKEVNGKEVNVRHYPSELLDSLAREMLIPHEPEFHINKIKNIKTFFHLSAYKSMKKSYYEFI